jgi:DNA-binding response OmpR family regulator
VISMRWAGARVRRGLGRVLGRGQGPAPARVLVADDDEAIRQLIAVYLAAAGFAVVQAGSGDVALEVAASIRVDVAVLDAGMPPPGGCDVACRLRASPATAGVRTLVLGSDRADRPGPAARPAVDACLAKPFSPAELTAVVLALVRRG